MENYTNIDMDDLDVHCAKLPGQMAYVSQQYADAEFGYAQARLNLKQVEASLYNQFRTELETGGKRPTEAAIGSSVTLDPSFATAHEVLAQAEAEVTRLKGMIDALRAKRDMLVALTATRRAEAGTWK